MNNFRIENKYKVELVKLDQVYKFLGNNFAKPLYPKRFIKSVYFDNQIFSSYNNSIEGIVPRKKTRIRTYSQNDIFDLDIIFSLENKINSVEGRFKTVEKNIKHIKLLNHGIFDNSYGLMFPKVEISYFREYYSIFNLRVTIDTKIKYKYSKDRNLQINDEECVLEVKSNDLDNINFIEDKIPFMKTRFSKYCNGVEKLKLL
jgi:hypothetical protein